MVPPGAPAAVPGAEAEPEPEPELEEEPDPELAPEPSAPEPSEADPLSDAELELSDPPGADDPDPDEPQAASTMHAALTAAIKTQCRLIDPEPPGTDANGGSSNGRSHGHPRASSPTTTPGVPAGGAQRCDGPARRATLDR